MDFNFYKGKKVFVTGHTGFKGSWLTKILVNLGAEVVGYALPPVDKINLYNLSKVQGKIKSVFGDIRDFDLLKKIFDECNPQIVFHLAGQPIVRQGYKNPKYTYDVNVMGAVNILECIRLNNKVKSFVNITTDKVYKPTKQNYSYVESDVLEGFDPYSNSKSCGELVTNCYKNSFFKETNVAISTARAGNVIGGGDFAVDRIIPDCVRAVMANKQIVVRNPHSTRPYQHVLDALFAYLTIAQKQYDNKDCQGCYNVGPDKKDIVTTGQLVQLFCDNWQGATWVERTEKDAPKETNFLAIDCSKIKTKLGWQPYWDINTAMQKTTEWTKAWLQNKDVSFVMDSQIEEFLK